MAGIDEVRLNVAFWRYFFREQFIQPWSLFSFASDVFYQTQWTCRSYPVHLFSIFGSVFAQTVFLQFLDLLNGIPADIADRNLCMFSLTVALFHEFFPSSFFCKRWQKQPDRVAVILRIDADVGSNDRTFDRLQHILFPGLYWNGPCIQVDTLATWLTGVGLP